MPEGHRVFAARSVLDGREHDGIIDRKGRHRSTFRHRRTANNQPRTPAERHASKVKRSSAI